MTSYLVGDGAHLERHPVQPGQILGHRVAQNSKAVADAGGVEEQGVQHVLVHLCALLICVKTEDVALIGCFISEWLTGQMLFPVAKCCLLDLLDATRFFSLFFFAIITFMHIAEESFLRI